MIEMLSQTLPVIIYILLIVLLIILITFGIKLLMGVNKLEKAIDEFVTKLESFKGIFNAVDFALDKFARLGDLVLDFISDKVRKISKRKKEMNEDE